MPSQHRPQPAVVTLLAFGFVGLWAVAGVLKGIEALPLAGTFFELVGITFSGVRRAELSRLRPALEGAPQEQIRGAIVRSAADARVALGAPFGPQSVCAH